MGGASAVGEGFVDRLHVDRVGRLDFERDNFEVLSWYVGVALDLYTDDVRS